MRINYIDARTVGTNDRCIRMVTELMSWKMIQKLFANHYVRLEEVQRDSDTGEIESAVVTRVGEPNYQDMKDMDEGISLDLYVPPIGHEKDIYISHKLNTEKDDDTIEVEIFPDEFGTISGIVKTDENVYDEMEGAYGDSTVKGVMDDILSRIFYWRERHCEDRYYRNIFIHIDNAKKEIGTYEEAEEMILKYRYYTLNPGY